MSEVHVADAAAIFQQYEKMIYSLVHKSIAFQGGVFDDLIGEAYEAFMEALQTYDPDKAEMSTWLYQKIYFKLLMTQTRTPEKRWNVSLVELTEVENASTPNVGTMATLDELSADAKSIAALVLDPPQWLSTLALKHSPCARHFKKTITDFLKAKGWKQAKIKRTFSEIQNALKA